MFNFIARIPDIFAACCLIFIFLNIAYSLWNAREASPYGITGRMLAEWIDPYKQTAFHFHYTKASIIILVFTIVFAEYHYLTMPKITPEGYTTPSIFLNLLTYLPNYLIHEFSHRFAWTITQNEFLTVLAGNAGETFVPLICCYYLLKLKGGRFLLPVARFWLATTLFDAGTYMSDARACKMALTSSDMMTNHAPGAAKGDWYHIFNSLGLLEYDQVFSTVFCALAVVILIIAFYSLWHFFAYLGEWQKEDSSCAVKEKNEPEIIMPEVWHGSIPGNNYGNAYTAGNKDSSTDSAELSDPAMEQARKIQRIQGIGVDIGSGGNTDTWEDPYEKWKRQQEQEGQDNSL